MPESARGLTVHECKSDVQAGKIPQLLFASLDSKVAGEVEQEFARAGHVVVSNSSNHRMEPDVPLLIPEVNPDHLALVRGQRSKRGWKGMIVTNPNCTTVGLVMSLAPLEKAFGLDKVLMTSMQAVSGAGYPGVPTLDILGNVIPHIAGEEEKGERGRQNLLGKLADGRVDPGNFTVSASCLRRRPTRLSCGRKRTGLSRSLTSMRRVAWPRSWGGCVLARSSSSSTWRSPITRFAAPRALLCSTPS